MATKDERFYWIVPEGGGKPERHTRATTFAATLDDRYALEKWAERRAAVGLVRRPDLLAQVAAYEEDACALDSIITKALEAGDATSSAELGKALHKMSERVDAGEIELSAVPELWRPDIEAYRKAMDAHSFSVELIETTVVLPPLGVAGTLDRLVTQGASECRVLDLKFGQSAAAHHLGAWAMQLALYAHGAYLYDLDTDARSPMPEVNQSIGYIAHIPAGSGACEIITLDLEAGWRGALIAREARLWRREKFEMPTTVGPLERRLWLSAELRRLVDHFPEAAGALAQQLAALGVMTPRQAKEAGVELTDDQIDLICNSVHVVEGEWRVPFAETPDPVHRDLLMAQSTQQKGAKQ